MLSCYIDPMRRVLPCVMALVMSSQTAWAGEAEDCATEAEKASDLKDSGQWRAAMRTFEGCARESCPRVVREDCRKALAEIHDLGPRVVVHVRDEQGLDVADARVTIDGDEIGKEDRMRGALVDRGTHRVRASYRHMPEVGQDVVVVAADRMRTVELVLRSSAPPVVKEEPASRNRTAPLVLGSFGLAAVAAFGVIGTWTYVEYRQLDTCRPNCDSSRVDPTHTRAYVADALLGVGLASLAVATVLWFTAPTRGSAVRASAQ